MCILPNVTSLDRMGLTSVKLSKNTIKNFIDSFFFIMMWPTSYRGYSVGGYSVLLYNTIELRFLILEWQSSRVGLNSLKQTIFKICDLYHTVSKVENPISSLLYILRSIFYPSLPPLSSELATVASYDTVASWLAQHTYCKNHS